VVLSDEIAYILLMRQAETRTSGPPPEEEAAQAATGRGSSPAGQRETQRNQEEFKKAFSACLETGDYTVK